MFLIFDTETTGLPKDWNAPITDSDNWPRLVQLAWQLHDSSGKLIAHQNYIVKPEGFSIPYNAEKVHGISTERALKDGHDLAFVLGEFAKDLERTTYNVGHNIEFDVNVVGAEYYRAQIPTGLMEMASIDTKDESVEFCAIPGGKGGRFKWPTLTELHTKLFGEAFEDAHDAAYDVDATARCFFGLVTHRVIQRPEIEDADLVKYEAPKLEAANFAVAKEEEQQTHGGSETTAEVTADLKDVPFTHLHCHSQFSVLQATSQIGEMVEKAKSSGMSAIALTDHGNMMAAYHFVRDALKAELKPIVGCEFYLCRDRTNKSQKNDGYQTVLLAKNKDGYHNLAKLSSIAYIEGFYYVPRIDKEALLAHKENLIATTGGLWGEIPFLILNEGEEKAEEAFLWWKEQFGEDFYVELNRHGVEEEDYVNKVLLGFAKKHGVKYFASNNSYYTDKKDAQAHDILICVKDAVSVNKPKKYIGKRGREFRYGFPNDEFYIKSPEEMKKLFADLPEAITTTNEIADKIEPYKLASDVLLPKFEIPEEFKDPQDDEDGGKRGENAYLKHLTYVGAEKRYGEVTDDIRERLDFELATIENTGYPGYFLIVQDFTTEARNMGVSVGPGRGSAAGSAVAYCIGITNVDPIKYDLLFERFLNPDRVSLPDIDIDFDDEGRGRVIDYVIDKYGSSQVAQIITYGTMAAKSSIRDTGRVLELPLPETDRIAKLVPDIKLNKLFGMDDKQLSSKLNADQLEMAKQLKAIAKQNNLEGETIKQATVLEGSVRNTGIHACGVIITPSDIREHIPVAVSKDSNLWCTQFDNSVVENAGLLKMDFLGLKTLTIIKDAIKIIKARNGVEIDPDKIPLDDQKTYELYQRGETNGTFQFESPGMQKHLRALKPDKFADLIAMNALYRPGPLEYIPNFIARKHGDETIAYDLDAMEEYLAETYGITVYQEQVMLLSQKLAGFTKGEADVLRKAMGKKIFALLEELKPKFIDGGTERGHDPKVLEKVWKDWEAFAAYAFNKSHSTCYSVVAFHTGYLKAHYPAEYMASVLTHNMNDIKKVTFFMEECRRMGLKVLGPDVNESYYKFAVNPKGEIRFGLGAVKGVGEGAVEAIVNERKENGNYNSIFDLLKRIDLKSANRKAMESLALSGALDSFDTIHRAQYFQTNETGQTYLEKIVKFGSSYQSSLDAPPDLFGDTAAVEVVEPAVPEAEEWSTLDKLKREKEVVGIYISGHPLDDHKLEIESFCNANLSHLSDMPRVMGRELKIAGIVTEVAHKTTKTGKPFGIFTIEDYHDTFQFFLFSDDYVKFKDYLIKDWSLFITGKVQTRRYDESRMEFKVVKIDLLADLRDKLAKTITINMEGAKVTDEFVEQLERMVNENAGKCRLNLILVDPKNQVKVNLHSRTKSVNLTPGFIDQLEAIQDLTYKIG